MGFRFPREDGNRKRNRNHEETHLSPKKKTTGERAARSEIGFGSSAYVTPPRVETRFSHGGDFRDYPFGQAATASAQGNAGSNYAFQNSAQSTSQKFSQENLFSPVNIPGNFPVRFVQEREKNNDDSHFAEMFHRELKRACKDGGAIHNVFNLFGQAVVTGCKRDMSSVGDAIRLEVNSLGAKLENTIKSEVKEIKPHKHLSPIKGVIIEEHSEKLVEKDNVYVDTVHHNTKNLGLNRRAFVEAVISVYGSAAYAHFMSLRGREKLSANQIVRYVGIVKLCVFHIAYHENRGVDVSLQELSADVARSVKQYLEYIGSAGHELYKELDIRHGISNFMTYFKSFYGSYSKGWNRPF